MFLLHLYYDDFYLPHFHIWMNYFLNFILEFHLFLINHFWFIIFWELILCFKLYSIFTTFTTNFFAIYSLINYYSYWNPAPLSIPHCSFTMLFIDCPKIYFILEHLLLMILYGSHPYELNPKSYHYEWAVRLTMLQYFSRRFNLLIPHWISSWVYQYLVSSCSL